MGAIRPVNYKNIAQSYANAQKQIVGVADYYYDAAYEIVLLQAFDPEIDLLQPFYQAYLAARISFLQAPSAVIAAVGALQRHILDKARTEAGEKFTDINDWIDAAGSYGVGTNVGREGEADDASFQVAQEFADLSFQAGFDIDDSLIDAAL